MGGSGCAGCTPEPPMAFRPTPRTWKGPPEPSFIFQNEARWCAAFFFARFLLLQKMAKGRPTWSGGVWRLLTGICDKFNPAYQAESGTDASPGPKPSARNVTLCAAKLPRHDSTEACRMRPGPEWEFPFWLRSGPKRTPPGSACQNLRFWPEFWILAILARIQNSGQNFGFWQAEPGGPRLGPLARI